jgi:hypothetical protein
VNIVGGEDGDDAGHATCAIGIDALDSRMSVRAAEQRHVQHAGQREVRHVRAAARDESRILLPQESPADQALAHGRIMAESRPPSR